MGDTSDNDVSYWPLLRSALLAALLAVVLQVFGVVWFGLQNGARVEIGLFWILPYLRVITTDVFVFNTIVKWSTVLTALGVTVFAVAAFVRGRRLQVQMGRSFGFLDLALLGFLHLWGERLNPGAAPTTRLMVYVLILGLVGFVLATFLVADSYREWQVARLGASGEVEPDGAKVSAVAP